MPRSIAPERAPIAGEERSSRGPAPLASVPPPADSVRDVAQEDFLFHLYRGSELLQDNRVLEAKEELEFALTMQPLDAKGQDLLAAVYFRLGLYPRAIQIYEALVEQFPRDVAVKVNLGLGLLKTGQPDRARAVLKEAVTLNQDHKRAWGYLGLALQKLGDLDQAQLAFERGGHPLMAKRVTESRQRSVAPVPPAPDSEVAAGVRQVFSELDASDLRFSVAPEPSKPGDGPWKLLEIGEPAAEPGPGPKTMPFVSARDGGVALESSGDGGPASRVDRGPASVAEEAFAHTRLPPPPANAPMGVSPMAPSRGAPLGVAPAGAPHPIGSLLEALGDGSAVGLATHPSGLLLVRTGAPPGRAFAGRLDAVRVVSGTAAPQVLRRRARDVETSEVLGGIGSPVVRFDGNAQLVFGPRAGGTIVVFRLDDGLVFVREEHLLGFDLGLAYENGKLALDAPGEAADASPIVQLRGTGGVALDVAGTLSSVPSAAERPLLVRREWVVGWIGRLMPRAVGATEAPNGQRGLVSFSGEGAVLVRVGG
jgi:hypothetical protein